MSQTLSLSVIICTYNRADYLRDTLHSLLTGRADPPLFEIIVINNNSTDDTAAVVQGIAEDNPNYQIRHIKESKQGLSHARNRGIGEAGAPFLLFVDDDIRAKETFIPAWLHFFRNHSNASAAGGKIHVQFDAPRPSWMSHFLLPLLGHHDLGKSRQKYPENKYPFGGNMGFRKSIFDEVGPFHTELGRKGKALEAGEEKELFHRIRAHGYTIHYLPDAFLYHRVDAGRLTIPYIRKQALGLGKSMNVQMSKASFSQQIIKKSTEAAKWLASIPLAIGYLFLLQPQKAGLLFKFRYWIWKGYRQAVSL